MANVNGFGMGPEWAQNGCGMGTPLDGRGDKTQKKIGRDRAERARTGAIHSEHVDGAMKVVWTCKYCIWRACFPHIAPCYEQALLTLLAFKVKWYFEVFRQEFIISLTINVPENTVVKYYYVYR